MAWQVTKRIWDSPSQLKTTEKLMLLALAEHADHLGVCWPAYDTLARMTGVNRRSAIRIVAALEARGAVWVQEQAGRGHCNRYLVTAGLGQEQIVHILHTHPSLKLDLPAAIAAAAAVSRSQPEPGKSASRNTLYPAGPEEKVLFATGNGVISGRNGASADTIYQAKKVLSETRNGVTADPNGVKSDQNGVTGNTRTIEPSKNDKESFVSGPAQPGPTPNGQTNPAGRQTAPVAARSPAFQPLVEALAAACRYDLNLISRAERAELERDARKMVELGYTPADLERFGRWWYASDWRGKQNQAPTLKNVRTMLSQFKQKGASNAHNSPARATGLGQWSLDELAGLRGPAGRA